MTNTSANKEKASAGDTIPSKCAVIEARLGELKQLFDSIVPRPSAIETWIRRRRNSSQVGQRICPVMHSLRWLWTLIEKQVYLTRLLFCETRLKPDFSIGWLLCR